MVGPLERAGGIAIGITVLSMYVLGINWLAQQLCPTTVGDGAEKQMAYRITVGICHGLVILVAFTIWMVISNLR